MASAAAPPGRTSILKLVAYLQQLVSREGVHVETGVRVTPEIIHAFNPDALILATGGERYYPPLPGISLPGVCTAGDVLSEATKVGDTTVVIGGGMVGLETADFLSKRNVSVTVLEARESLMLNEDLMTKKLLLMRLNERGVAVYVNCRIERITGKGVLAQTLFGQKMFPAHNVVLATGYIAGNELLRACDLGETECYIIGDARSPAGILEAIRDGFQAGNLV